MSFDDLKFCNCRQCYALMFAPGQDFQVASLWSKLSDNQKKMVSSPFGGRVGGIPYCPECLPDSPSTEPQDAHPLDEIAQDR